MKITAYVTNYTGAHFRGIPDATDERMCKIVLHGDEHKIVTFLLTNCAYGQLTQPLRTISALALGLTGGFVPQSDGCGSIERIVLEDSAIAYDAFEANPPCDDDFNELTFEQVQFVDLGIVNVDKVKPNLNNINNMLEVLEGAGRLPKRPCD